MINQILNAFDQIGINKWRITKVEKHAHELFFIRKKLDMNRTKSVTVYEVTVYVDFVVDGQSYCGQSTTTVDDSIDEVSLVNRFTELCEAARYVENEAFNLYKPELNEKKCVEEPNAIFVEGMAQEKLASIKEWVDAIYFYDNKNTASINSAELFMNQKTMTIMTSEGVNVSYDDKAIVVEVVSDCESNEGESVELLLNATYGYESVNQFKEDVKDLLWHTNHRANAKKMPDINSVDVLLEGDDVVSLFEAYMQRASGSLAYEQMTTYKLNESIYTSEAIENKLTLWGLRAIEGSAYNRPYDQDGYPLEDQMLIKDGILIQRMNDCRYAQYLMEPTTGTYMNLSVEPGTLNETRLNHKPYLKIIAFSDLNIDPIAGDIGGEIRLAAYYDKGTVTYYTGGAISTNINLVEKTMLLSEKKLTKGHYLGPQSVLFQSLKVTGA